MNVLLKHNLGYIKQYFGVFLELMDVNICTNFILLRYSEHGWLIGVYPLVMQTRQNIALKCPSLDFILFDLLCLTPLSAIFQLYDGDQF